MAGSVPIPFRRGTRPTIIFEISSKSNDEAVLASLLSLFPSVPALRGLCDRWSRRFSCRRDDRSLLRA
ncbi:MAG: hypothetical protein LZF86_250014 [Nitrospira sp.]|nr:MAG: hypothetical protein LZF86_250014 [Nitrospira sp.]